LLSAAGFDTSKVAESHPFDSKLTDTSRIGDTINHLPYQHGVTRAPETDQFDHSSTSSRSSSSYTTPSNTTSGERTIIDHHYQQNEQMERKELSSDEEDSSVDEDYQVLGVGDDTSGKRSEDSKDASNTFHHHAGREENDTFSSDEEDESSIVGSNGDHESNYVFTKNIRKKVKGCKKDSLQSKEERSFNEKKVKENNPNSFQQLKERRFNDQFNQLLRFKEVFGHCNVPANYPPNPTLGNWCRNVKQQYKGFQQTGLKPKSIVWQEQFGTIGRDRLSMAV